MVLRILLGFVGAVAAAVTVGRLPNNDRGDLPSGTFVVGVLATAERAGVGGGRGACARVKVAGRVNDPNRRFSFFFDVEVAETPAGRDDLATVVVAVVVVVLVGAADPDLGGTGTARTEGTADLKESLGIVKGVTDTEATRGVILVAAAGILVGKLVETALFAVGEGAVDAAEGGVWKAPPTARRGAARRTSGAASSTFSS